MTTLAMNLPIISQEAGLTSYMQMIKNFPVLTEEEELDLANKFRKVGDVDAAHKLVTSHLRLAAKIAFGYRHYGLSMADLISEANIGLMHAVKKFEPEKGFRLSTYAIWWIKASIHEFIIKSWSLVKMGTVVAQKKLFYNLAKMKAKIGAYSDKELGPEEIAIIARDLNVGEDDVKEMNLRLMGDTSLNAYMDEEEGTERVDFLVDETDNQEELLSKKQEQKYLREVLSKALLELNEREKEIIIERKLRSHPATLEFLGYKYGISRERVRQIENRAFEKLKNIVVSEVKNPEDLGL
ncbi:MAG: RNA polymerase sigma factor RpoH [Alphaproteobacteria bacterium]